MFCLIKSELEIYPACRITKFRNSCSKNTGWSLVLFLAVLKRHTYSLNPNVAKCWRDSRSHRHIHFSFFFDELEMCTWALQKAWGFNPQLCRQTDTRCIQWEFVLSKQLGIVHLCTCLNVGLSQVNTRVAVRTNLLLEPGAPCVPRVTGDTATPGASCSLVLRTPMAPPTCVLPQERSDRYLWGHSSLRHSAFGTRRYCSPLEDVLGQILASKMPVLTDKAQGSSSPSSECFQPACLLLPEAEELAWCFSGPAFSGAGINFSSREESV